MSRYIDIETIKPRQYENSEVELGVLAYDYDEVNAMPFLDIVRCYYCKHYREEDVGVGDYQWCELLQREVEKDWFCASGERIEE